MGLIMAFVVLGGWLVPSLIQLTRAGRLAGPLAKVAAANLRARVRFAAPQIVPWVLVGTLFFGVGSALRIGGAGRGEHSILQIWEAA